MKLTLSQLQCLDYLLKRLPNINSSNPAFKNLKLVIKINNSLWTGDFIHYSDTSIVQQYIDIDFGVENSYLYPRDVFNAPRDFSFAKYRYIKEDTIYLLLSDLCNLVKNLPASEVTLDSYLFDSMNLESNLKLPFILLDPSVEYEVISLISTKDECTHS